MEVGVDMLRAHKKFESTTQYIFRDIKTTKKKIFVRFREVKA